MRVKFELSTKRNDRFTWDDGMTLRWSIDSSCSYELTCSQDVCGCTCTSTGAWGSCYSESEIQDFIDTLGGCSYVKSQIGGSCANAGPIVEAQVPGTSSATCSDSYSSSYSSSFSSATAGAILGVLFGIGGLVAIVVTYYCCFRKKSVSWGP